MPSFLRATTGQSLVQSRMLSSNQQSGRRPYGSMFIGLLQKLLYSNIISVHPLPSRKPQCNSGHSYSVTFCNSCCNILARTLPTTSSKAIPCQLSLAKVSLGTIFKGYNCVRPVPWNHFLFHTLWIRSDKEMQKP